MSTDLQRVGVALLLALVALLLSALPAPGERRSLLSDADGTSVPAGKLDS